MMAITRRDFLKYCGISAAVLGLSGKDLLRLEQALAATGAPTVVWLQGSACTGCSVSFLNRISGSAPTTAADVLINDINLAYHPNLMSLAGQAAAEQAEAAYNAGGYILAVEGGVPTAFGGAACWAWNYNGVDVTFQQAVKDLASRASYVLAIGTCASFGGIPAAGPNPAGIQAVSQATGLTPPNLVNIAGCPTHPDWITWVVVQLLSGNPPGSTGFPLDSHYRPTQFFSQTVHSQCPRLDNPQAITFGVDNTCLIYLGCQGPVTYCSCPAQLWNNRQNWCIDANARCLGCTEPAFPFAQLFSYVGGGNEEHSASYIRAHQYHCNQCHSGQTVGGGD